MLRPSDAIAVSGLGMVSAVGNDVATACASVRAGVSRAAELNMLDFRGNSLFGREHLDEGPVIYGHSTRGIAEGFSGPAKVLLLCQAALDDLLTRAPLTADERLQTTLLLNITDDYILDKDAASETESHPPQPSAAWKHKTRELLPKLAAAGGFAPKLVRDQLYYGGNAGFAHALREACALLRSGRAERCIVGAVDSRTEARFLPAAARLQLLRTVDNATGLIPGEAAAFVLLERASELRRKPEAYLLSAEIVDEGVDLLSRQTAPSGRGLATLIGNAMQQHPTIGFVVADLDGCSRRAMEWGMAQVRLRAKGLAELEAWYPAAELGSTGAAAGGVACCVTVRAFTRHYAPAPLGLITCSSERGIKGAIVLQAA
jgi:3-oxoacyl-[acyl-carrier-protein] synthase-1